MNIKKTIGITAALAVLGVGVWGSSALAASTTTKTNRMDGMVSALAQRFNLNQADVQKFFDDQHASMEGNHAAAMKTRLDQAVKDGKITPAQEDAILSKHAEMKTLATSLKDKTPEERQAAMKTHTDSLKQWATDNKIPTEFLRAGMGGPSGKGHHGKPGMGMRGEFKGKLNSSSPTSTK